METLPLQIIFMVVIIVILITTIGVTLYDIRMIKQMRDGKRRPRLPYIALPEVTTIPQFFITYYYVAQAVFAKSRSGLGISQKRLPKRAVAQQRWNRAYKVASQLILIVTPLVISYIALEAFVADQTILFVLALSGFGAFMIVAIWYHDYLTIHQKVLYCLLLPTTIGFFFVMSWGRLLETVANMAKAVVPIGVGLFVRVKDIGRII